MFVDVSKPEKSVKDDFLCTILLMLLATQINRRRDNMQKSSLVIVSPEWRHTAYLYIYIYVFFGGGSQGHCVMWFFQPELEKIEMGETSPGSCTQEEGEERMD